MWGLESVSGDALVIRLVMKTRANAKDDVARELRMRLKHAIDEMGLTLPAAQLDHAERPRGRPARARRQSAQDEADDRDHARLRRRPSARCGGRRRRRRPAEAARPRQPRGVGMSISFYDEVGGHETFVRLVDAFYRGVADDEVLRPMYPEEDLGPAKERLTLFLEQYWGGPTTYSQERGHPRLRMRHAPFHVNPDARDRWLAHMRAAVDELGLSPLHEATLWDYLQRAALAMVNTFEPTGIGPVRGRPRRGIPAPDAAATRTPH